MAKHSADTLKRLGREDQGAADELRADSTIMKLEGAARSIAKQRRQLGQIMNEHHHRPDTWIGELPMTSEQKRKAIDLAIHRMDMIAGQANDTYFDRKEERKAGQ